MKTRNYNVYLKGMAKAEKEKLFFLDHLDLNNFDTIVDFGCGSGSIIKECLARTKKAMCWAVDHDPFMIDRVKNNCGKNKRLETAYLIQQVHPKGKILIIFSSILHEIDNSTWENIEKFIFLNRPTIVVRDMKFGGKLNELCPTVAWREELLRCPLEKDSYERPYNLMLGQAAPIEKSDLAKLVRNANPVTLSEFIAKWGMKTEEDLYHYLLKYTYLDNWQLELQENYFGFNFDKLFRIGTYNVIYWREYTLEFKKKQVKEQFGIDLRLPTHYQLILEYK